MNKLLARKNTNKKPHFSERRLIARHFRAAEVSISAEANTSSTSSPDPTKDDDTRVFIITRFKHTLGSINLQIKISWWVTFETPKAVSLLHPGNMLSRIPASPSPCPQRPRFVCASLVSVRGEGAEDLSSSFVSYYSERKRVMRKTCFWFAWK